MSYDFALFVKLCYAHTSVRSGSEMYGPVLWRNSGVYNDELLAVLEGETRATFKGRLAYTALVSRISLCFVCFSSNCKEVTGPRLVIYYQGRGQCLY